MSKIKKKSSKKEVWVNQSKIFIKRIFELSNLFIKNISSIFRSISSFFFNFFKRFNYFTLFNDLSNIVCSRFFKKRFCFRKRFNFDYFKRINSFAIFQTISIFSFFFSNFVIILSILKKLTLSIVSSHFLSIRIYFAHFLNKKKRYFF